MRFAFTKRIENNFDRKLRGLACAQWWTRISIAALLVGLAAAARVLLGGYADTLSPYATFYLAIETSALLSGLSAGLFATIASAGVAYLWFSAAPDVSLGLFVAGGVIFSILTEAARRTWRGFGETRTPDRTGVSRAAHVSPFASHDRLDTVGGTAAALAHEVNQPLAATVTYLKVARRLLEKSGAGSPEIFDVLEKASEQTLRAGRIVTSLRDLVRRRELDRSLVHVNALIDETIETPEIFALSAGASIEIETRAEHDSTLADREQIRQVIIGLARNALEAMRAAETRRLVISTSNPDEHNIQVDVIDTGCGLPDFWADGAFERFATTKANGMGVGLSISKAIIERHEGRIWAEPNRNGGAVFSFILPLAETQIAESELGA